MNTEITNSRLHHYCQDITEGRLNDVIEMYKLLGFEVTYRPPGNKSWIMIGQPKLNFGIQIAEVGDKPIENIDKKIQTHIGFISDDPDAVVKKVQAWAETKGFRFRRGQWSDIELYFDLPDIFVNFVVEVMHVSIEES